MATLTNPRSDARRPRRSLSQPPGYWYTPSRKSSTLPKRPTARIGAPRACRYFGRNFCQRFSPSARRNIAVETATTFGSRARNVAARDVLVTPPDMTHLLALLLVVNINVLQNCCGAREAIAVVVMRHGDAGDHHGHPRHFRAIEFRLFQIDVVNDLGDGAHGRIVDAQALDQHLERAAVALVREFGIERVEADFVRFGRVVLSLHELEAGLRIDEAFDQPRAGHPVDVDAGACNPRAPAIHHGHGFGQCGRLL